MSTPKSDETVRYEPDEPCPPLVALSVGLQGVMLVLAAVVILALRASVAWRIWSPLLAIAAGCTVAALFGAYELRHIRDAAWVGLPGGGFAGFDLTPGVEFWALLPAFVVVALVGAVKNIGDCIAVQQVSWRRPRVTDFRRVQGSLNGNGLGILLSGLAGTPPTTVYSSSSPLLISLTGVAVRQSGAAVELEFLATFDEENLQDRLAYLSEESQGAAGAEEGAIPLRLLRHYASSVRHQKFHGLDVVTVQVTERG